MGILDDAIREHLELKRQHGAEESEIEGLEAEAFGPADRPDATGEATQVLEPAGGAIPEADEGDQLDKVFEATEQATADAPIAEPSQEPQAVEAPDEVAEIAEEEAPAEVGEPVAQEPEPSAPAEPAPEGDAGDMLEAERHHLASHPTEHYDVDAAFAEEDEIDLLSESSLSDELDRALGDPEAGGEGAPAPAPAVEPLPEPAPEPVADPEPAPEEDEGSIPEPDLDEDDVDEEADSDEEVEEGPEPDFSLDSSAQFFDQDDPLEGTPDFLEETPEHDRLWFEQKEPKDFDFGD